jgi:hypothetical protein
VLALAGGLTCAPQEEEKSQPAMTSRTYPLRISQDSTLWEFKEGAVIGTAWFSESYGPVGMPIAVVIHMSASDDMKAIFQHKIFEGALTLLNADLTTSESFEIPFQYEYDAHDEDGELAFKFGFYIPQVISIPATLDFDIRIWFRPEDEEDFFEAFNTYQFTVNQGKAATP